MLLRRAGLTASAGLSCCYRLISAVFINQNILLVKLKNTVKNGTLNTIAEVLLYIIY